MNLENIFKKQKEYYNLGYTKSVTLREMMLNRLLNTIKANEKQLLKALEKDLGKNPTEAYMSEIGILYKSIKHAINNVNKWSKKEKKKTNFFLPFSKAYTKSVPYGNTLIFSAFNYPVLLSLDPLVGAIAAGNTAMVALPASVSNTNKVLIKILNEAFEEKYLYLFETNRDLNQKILKFKFNKIFYTGNKHVGKIVAKAASENLVPTTLELGGKSPAIVTKNANLKKIVKSIVWGKMINSGQTCVAVDYILVHKSLKEDLIKEIVEAKDKMYTDDLENSKDYGRLVSEDSVKKALKLLEADNQYIINKDFKFNIEKRHLDLVLLKSFLDNVENLKVMEEELFLPILPIIEYEEIDDAIDYINSKPTPLAFYPFSQDSRDINYLLNHCEFGGATVNSTILHLSNLYLPFGGLHDSGYGNYHGKYSFDTFSHKQSVLKTSTLFRNTLMYPPYKKIKKKLIYFFLK